MAGSKMDDGAGEDETSQDEPSDDVTSNPAHDPDSAAQLLIEAATALFAERGPNEVSVREIARRAGVNHGLVHYYFGSKSGLVAAVLDHLARTRAARTGDGLPRPDQPLPISPEDRLHLRVLARIVLDGAVPPSSQSVFPLVDRLARLGHETFGLDRDTARLRATQAMGMLLGWFLFEPWLLNAGGFEESQAEALRAKLVESMALLGATSPPPIVEGYE